MPVLEADARGAGDSAQVNHEAKDDEEDYEEDLEDREDVFDFAEDCIQYPGQVSGRRLTTDCQETDDLYSPRTKATPTVIVMTIKMTIHKALLISVQNWNKTQMAVISDGMDSRLPYTRFQPMAKPREGSTRNSACLTKLPVTWVVRTWSASPLSSIDKE